MKLEDATVLVAGGGRGIGRAVVERFVQSGCRVVVCDTDNVTTATNHYRGESLNGFVAARRLVARLGGKGARIRAFEADVTQETAVVDLFDSIRRDAGRLDVVVNAFGVTHVSLVEEMGVTDFQAVVNGNLLGVFVVCKHAVPLLRDSGGGSIVNFSSVSGKSGFAKVAHYCAAKAGIIGFTQALALEVAQWNIRVNAVCPGIVHTNMWEYLLDEFTRPAETREACWQRICELVPQKAPQTPEEVADAVLFLATARAVTGQAMSVDGGMTS